MWLMPDHTADPSNMVPRRIQRRRAKGWRMPPGAVYVGRPTMWGNRWDWRDCPPEAGPPAWARGVAVDLFRRWLGPQGEEMTDYPGRTDMRSDILRRIGELRGRDLACWCPLDQPCHADVLLALANAPRRCEAV